MSKDKSESIAQTLQLPWELLPSMCCLFEGIHRKKVLLGSLSVHVEEHSQPAESKMPRQDLV